MARRSFPSAGTPRVLGAEAPTEHSSLLPISTAPLLESQPSYAGPSPLPIHESPTYTLPSPTPRRPLLLRAAYLVTVVLWIISTSATLLIGVSVTSPLIALGLPPHSGSTFLPYILAASSLVINLLTFIDFVLIPSKRTGRLERTCMAVVAVCAVVMGIVILAVGGLRQREGVLTALSTALVILSCIMALSATTLAERFDHDEHNLQYTRVGQDELGPDPTSLKHVMFSCITGTLSFISVTLPVVLVHLVLLAVFILLALNVILRAYDESLAAPGKLWSVDPWRENARRYSDNSWESERHGREYKVHLNCQAVDKDPLLVSKAGLPVRTVLVESSQGVTGGVAAQWIAQMPDLDNADREVRVCYWDRPGCATLFPSSPHR